MNHNYLHASKKIWNLYDYITPTDSNHGLKEDKTLSDSETLIRKFVQLQSTFQESLNKTGRTQRVINFLFHLYTMMHQNKGLVSLDRLRVIKEIHSEHKLMMLMSPFTSFLEYYLLSFIIEEFGDKKDKQNFSDYFQQLKKWIVSWQVLDGGDQLFRVDSNVLGSYHPHRLCQIIAFVLDINPSLIQLEGK